MPIYQGQPTALAAPIIPVVMVSAALAGDAANKASAQHNAAMNGVSRDEAMAVPPELLSALLLSRRATLLCRLPELATMRRSVRTVHAAGERRGTRRLAVNICTASSF